MRRRCSLVAATIAVGAGLAVGATSQDRPAASPRVTVVSAGDDRETSARLRSAADAGLRVIAEWFGPYPAPALTIAAIDASRTPDPAFASDAIVVHPRWWSAAGDRSIERELLTALASRFWSRVAGLTPAPGSMLAGLGEYAGVRLAHELLREAHAPAFRYFGGGVAYLTPYVHLSTPSYDLRPPVTAFPSEDASLDAQWQSRPSRAALGFFTLERDLGWADMQAVLVEFAARARQGKSAAGDFGQTVKDVAGRDLGWFIEEVFAGTRAFDYAIAPIVDEPAPGGARRSTIIVDRLGEAVYARPARATVQEFDATGAIEVLVRFADGSEVRERWDGRAARKEFVYESPAPAIAASIDPDRILLLDVNPFNNGTRTRSVSLPVAARWSLQWLAWLQEFVLTTTALV